MNTDGKSPHRSDPLISAFIDPAMAAGYAERTARIVPALSDLHAMTGLLLAESSPLDARVLVLGAGGGLETKALALQRAGWSFYGVDPSNQMLEQARVTLGDIAPRVSFYEGKIESASEGPFDAATCLLTLHFLDEDQRRRTVAEIYRRLRPGAPFVVAHHSFPLASGEKDKWLGRGASFSILSGVPPLQAENSRRSIAEMLPVLSPEQDIAILHEAGFVQIELFYAALTFKGWVCRKPKEEEGH